MIDSQFHTNWLFLIIQRRSRRQTDIQRSVNDFIFVSYLRIIIIGIFFAVIIYKETNCQFCSIMKRKGIDKLYGQFIQYTRYRQECV